MASRRPHGTLLHAQCDRTYWINYAFTVGAEFSFASSTVRSSFFFSSLSDTFIRRIEYKRSSLNGTHRCLFISIKFIASSFLHIHEAEASADRFDISESMCSALGRDISPKILSLFKLLLLFNLLNSISMQNMTSFYMQLLVCWMAFSANKLCFNEYNFVRLPMTMM